MKILAIDDYEDSLTILLALVHSALPECVVLTAQNGPDGIELARAEDPDVILLDIVMPGMDGFEVCRRLKADDTLCSIPVVVLTAFRADRESRLKALESGAEAFLSKPLDEPELVALIRTMAKLKVANRQQRLENEQLAARVAERTRDHQAAAAALRASELRYRRLFESAKDGILILDAETGMIVDVNPFLVKLLGFSFESFLGKKVWELGFFKDIFANQASFAELQEKEYVRYENLPLETRDGRRIEVEFVSNVYRVDNAKVIQCNIRDITERKRLEQERVVMEAQLRQQQKLEAIGTLAAGVAHEINNPINGVMNYAQLIVDESPASTLVAGYAREIICETERVATIVRNLLQFARQEKSSHSPARPEDVINQTLSLIRTVIRHDQITLDVEVPQDLPDVNCRSQQIQQVLMNLLINARDSLNEKYPGYDEHKKIIIRAQLIADWAIPDSAIQNPPSEIGGFASRLTDHALRITVEDHGAGIPVAAQRRIFDPFFSTKSRHQGTGLGLAISHGIVKDHQGRLWFETVPGQGAKFHLELPVEQEENAFA